MPTTDGYGQKVPYPVLSDAPNFELAFQGAVNALAGQSVMRFANANERSATLIGAFKAVPGMISYLIAEDRWDRYDGDGVWRPMSPGPWKPFTYASGYVANTGSPGYRIVNGEVHLRGTLKKSNDTDFAADSETLLGTLPTEARPTGASKFFIVATAYETISGRTYLHGRIAVLPNGQMLYVIPAGGKTPWISIDGIRFNLN
ncbi:hypothetical protein [Streptomyces sp. NPDC058542]|uniref:hypothetical protein n=1 Tax=Streptomyces sp. NPDC058542 TaxID=3346543 RepID=UPI003656F73D